MVFHRWIHANRNQRFKSYHLRYASRTYRQYQVAVKLPGSFRLAAGNRHLHRYCIFTEQVSETVAQTLHYSTRRNLPDKELRYLLLICISLCRTNSIFSRYCGVSVWFLRILEIETSFFDSSVQSLKRSASSLPALNEPTETSFL